MYDLINHTLAIVMIRNSPKGVQYTFNGKTKLICMRMFLENTEMVFIVCMLLKYTLKAKHACSIIGT